MKVTRAENHIDHIIGICRGEKNSDLLDIIYDISIFHPVYDRPSNTYEEPETQRDRDKASQDRHPKTILLQMSKPHIYGDQCDENDIDYR
jgi:hypothetical protein